MNNFGPFLMSLQAYHLYKPEFINQLINQIQLIDGFLCNAQIPIMFDMATRFSGNWVEVGCWKGRTTATLLLGGNPENLIYCVDTFKGSEEHQEVLKGGSTKDDFLKTINSDFLKQSQSSIGIIEKTSVEASQEFQDNFFDVVFIDAAHDFDNVSLDINSWYPKLKSGGIMIGHDYPDPNDPNGGFEDLKRAVNSLVRDTTKFENFGYVAGLWGAYKR